MPTFTYRHLQEMDPLPGRRYATTYIKQSAQEHARLQAWLVEIAEQILGACSQNASAAEWFSSPMTEFKKSQRNHYYTPEELLTDMIDQLAHGRDLPEAMLNRWNRLTEGTPWQIEFLPSSDTKPQSQVRTQLFA